MTNREWLSTLTDLELSIFIYRTLIPIIGRNYPDSISGVASWLNEEHSEKKSAPVSNEKIIEATS